MRARFRGCAGIAGTPGVVACERVHGVLKMLANQRRSSNSAATFMAVPHPVPAELWSSSLPQGCQQLQNPMHTPTGTDDCDLLSLRR